MKYRKMSVFIIISIFLLMSVSFASAEDGKIFIDTYPDFVHVDFVDYGGYFIAQRTPVTVSVPAGSYTIKFTRKGYYDEIVTTNVKSGATSDIFKEMRKQTGSISVTSDPSGADVYLEGELKGMIPLLLHDVTIYPKSFYTDEYDGTIGRVIRVKKSGYEDNSVAANVVTDQTSDVFLRMREIRPDTSSSGLNSISGFSGFLLLLSLIIGAIVRKR